MQEVQFADGFDGIEAVAFGLGPAQLLGVVVGLLITYVVLQAPLPLYLSAPAGLVMLLGSAGLGWLRIEGCPSMDWLWRSVQYLVRRHRGDAVFAPAALSAAGSVAPPVRRAARRPAPALERAGPRPAVAGPGASPNSAPGPLAATASLRARKPLVVTFFALAGGGGRTTLATESACLLAERGQWAPDGSTPPQRLKVALLDLDALSPAVTVRLGIAQPTGWDYATAGHGAADPASRLVEHGITGLRVLPGPPHPLNPRAQLAERGRYELVMATLRAGGAHIVIIDIGTDLGPMARWALHRADRIYVVVTPTPGGILDAYRSTALLRRLGYRAKLAHVANRCSDRRQFDELMGDLGAELVAAVPPDPGFCAAEARHQALCLAGGPAAATGLTGLAAHVCGPIPAGS